MVTMPDIEHLGPWIPRPAVLGYGFLPAAGRTPTPSQANQEGLPKADPTCELERSQHLHI
jgi:hypothetical protein